MRPASLISGLFWACFLTALPWANADTVLQYTSTPSNYVSRIPGHTLTPNARTRFRIEGQDRGNTVYIQITQPPTPASGAETILYVLKFSAPTGSALGLGTYDYPGVFATPKTPGFDFFGSQGISDPVSGQFRVTELTHDAAGLVVSFAATFSKLDRNNADSCYGSIEYNSGQPQPPVVLPVVSVVATTAAIGNGSGEHGVFTIQRTGATTDPLTVGFTLGGKAINGVDYLRLGGTATIGAGRTTAVVKVYPLDRGLSGKAGVRLTLSASAGSPYAVGGTGRARMTIFR